MAKDISKELKDRLQSGSKEIEEVLSKYKLVIVPIPQVRPNGTIGAVVQLQEAPPEVPKEEPANDESTN